MYFEGSDVYRQRQLTWYSPDNVLTDAQEKPIEEVHLTVGDMLELFDDMDPSEENVIYVRNPLLKFDFEITRNHESYSESVLGLGT